MATAWKDNKVVNVASTLADPTQLTTVKRRQKDGTIGSTLSVPSALPCTMSTWEGLTIIVTISEAVTIYNGSV